MTFFYGRLADKIGRKPVMLIGMTGQILAFFWVIAVCEFGPQLAQDSAPQRLITDFERLVS